VVQVQVAPPAVSPGQRTRPSSYRRRFAVRVPHPCQMGADRRPGGIAPTCGRCECDMDACRWPRVGVVSRFCSWQVRLVTMAQPGS